MDEYAHQVDYFVLHAEHRSVLREELGAQAWCYELSGLAHSAYGCERFSSMLAWAYWPSQQSSYRPESRSDESASMPAAEFRALMANLIGAPRTLASVKQSSPSGPTACTGASLADAGRWNRMEVRAPAGVPRAARGGAGSRLRRLGGAAARCRP